MGAGLYCPHLSTEELTALLLRLMGLQLPTMPTKAPTAGPTRMPTLVSSDRAQLSLC